MSRSQESRLAFSLSGVFAFAVVFGYLAKHGRPPASGGVAVEV